MIAWIYFAAFALGIVVGGSIVGIINGRQDRKDRELERLRHETVTTFLTRLDEDCVRLAERFDAFGERTGAELSAFEKDFIRRCRVDYVAMAEEAKERGEIEC